MRKTIACAIILATAFPSFSQNDFNHVLSLVERNNPTLKVLRSQIEAEKDGNRAGNTLENPEVEVGYLFGSPSATGNRTDFSVTQSFDFPTLYLSRKKLIGLENNSLELKYATERLNVLLETQRTCAELVFHNAIVELYGHRLQLSQDLLDVYRGKFENGEVNILDINKIEFEHLSLKAVYNEAVLHRDGLLADLAKLNGGEAMDFETDTFCLSPIDEDFEEWYSRVEGKIPQLRLEENALTVEQQKLRVEKSGWLPQLSVGYTSEKGVEESFRGVTVGVSLPLWSNGRNVRTQKARLQTAETRLQSVRIQYRNELRRLHARALALQKNVDDMQNIHSACNSGKLLKKAFDAGEISLLTYIQEQGFYCDAAVKLLEFQRDAMLARIELYAMDL